MKLCGVNAEGGNGVVWSVVWSEVAMIVFS
jgi:hypothetical protein